MHELIPLLLNILSSDLHICLHGDALSLIFKSCELSDQQLLLITKLSHLITQSVILLTGYLGWGLILWHNNRDLGLLLSDLTIELISFECLRPSDRYCISLLDSLGLPNLNLEFVCDLIFLGMGLPEFIDLLRLKMC